MVVDESGIGVYEDKVHKIQSKTRGTMRDMVGARTCGLVEEDRQKGLRVFAKPMDDRGPASGGRVSLQ